MPLTNPSDSLEGGRDRPNTEPVGRDLTRDNLAGSGELFDPRLYDETDKFELCLRTSPA
jgi:hypothetical protein